MTDQQPVPETPDAPLPPLTENEQIRELAAEATELAQSTAKTNLSFPVIGFIDIAEELEKVRRAAGDLPEGDRRAYPEQIRAKLLAHHANPELAPAVTDEELALAIYIRRTTDTPLTDEDVEAKTTGKAAKKAKEPKLTKAEKSSKAIDDLLSGV